MEISVIPNTIPDNDPENTVISICRDSGVEIEPKDIEGCHRLPLSRNSRGQDKRVIVKFVNRKHSEVLLRDKKRISSKSFNHLNVPDKFFVSVSLCPYYRYIWGKCKDLQRQGQVNHVFCLGGVVCIKLSENGSPIKLYHMNNIPDFPSQSSVENEISVYIMKPFIFLLMPSFNFPANVSTITFLPLTPLLISLQQQT